MCDTVPKLDRAILRARLQPEFERVVDRVADAVEKAPPGRLLQDSQESATNDLNLFQQVVYQQIMQAKLDMTL